MAKTREKNKAIKLRENGESIKKIAKKVKVSKGTVSLWCRDIKLTPQQIEKLSRRMVVGGYKGRLKGARTQYKNRLNLIKKYKKEGLKRLGKISNKNFLIAGIALYWGEGSRSRREVRITNSDPKMIQFMVKWFKKIWGISKRRFTLHLLINKIHKKRIKKVENYWSKITKIPRNQFIKTTLIKAKNKKHYDNLSNHYGTLTIRIKRSAELYYRIMGIMEGLYKKIK